MTNKKCEFKENGEGFTPGQWGWFGNGSMDEIYLATKNNGRIFVMQFKEPPLFRVDNRMVSAINLAKFEVGDPRVTGMRQAEKSKSTYRYHIDDIDHPDARLIAAAPDLYDAVKQLLKWCDTMEPNPDLCADRKAAYAAIAKVRGHGNDE